MKLPLSQARRLGFLIDHIGATALRDTYNQLFFNEKLLETAVSKSPKFGVRHG